MVKQVHAVAHHRNGVCGAPFHVVTFTANHDDGPEAMIGIVFDEPAHCAVLSMGLLAEGNIAFGVNSWRGDHYDGELRTAIEAYWIEREKEHA